MVTIFILLLNTRRAGKNATLSVEDGVMGEVRAPTAMNSEIKG